LPINVFINLSMVGVLILFWLLY